MTLFYVILDVPNALDWADFAFKVVTFVIGIGLNVLMFVFLVMMARTLWSFYTEGRHGDFPSMKIMFRRLYCRHRNLSYVKTRYGFKETCCASCGVNVNKNRSVLMRR